MCRKGKLNFRDSGRIRALLRGAVYAVIKPGHRTQVPLAPPGPCEHPGFKLQLPGAAQRERLGPGAPTSCGSCTPAPPCPCVTESCGSSTSHCPCIPGLQHPHVPVSCCSYIPVFPCPDVPTSQGSSSTTEPLGPTGTAQPAFPLRSCISHSALTSALQRQAGAGWGCQVLV